MKGKAAAARDRRKLFALTAYYAGHLSQMTSKYPAFDAIAAAFGVKETEAENTARRRRTADEQLALAIAWTRATKGQVVYR